MSELSEALDHIEDHVIDGDSLNVGETSALFLEWRQVHFAPFSAGEFPPFTDLRNAAKALTQTHLPSGGSVDGLMLTGASWCWPDDVWRANFSMDMDPEECVRRSGILTQRIGPAVRHPERVEIRWTVARTLTDCSAVLRTSAGARVLMENPEWRGHLPLVWLPAAASTYLQQALARAER